MCHWLVAEGDTVEKGDPLMEVETDKVTMEVEAPEDGVLRGLLVKDGDVVPVTEIIAYIVPEGEEWTVNRKKSSHASNRKRHRLRSASPQPMHVDIDEVPSAQWTEDSTARCGELFAEAGCAGQWQRLFRPESDKLRATPAARRIAREREIDLAQVSGSGPKGRMQADDVAAFELSDTASHGRNLRMSCPSAECDAPLPSA